MGKKLLGISLVILVLANCACRPGKDQKKPEQYVSDTFILRDTGVTSDTTETPIFDTVAITVVSDSIKETDIQKKSKTKKNPQRIVSKRKEGKKRDLLLSAQKEENINQDKNLHHEKIFIFGSVALLLIVSSLLPKEYII